MFGLKYKYLWYNAYKKQDIRTLPIFADCAKKVIETERTYLGYDRLYTLHQLLYQLKEDQDVVEIGVFRGGSSFFMADVLKQLGKDNKIFSCDTFTGHSNVDPERDGWHQVGSFSSVSIDDVSNYLSGFPNVNIVQGDITKTAKSLPIKNLGLVHIDVDVYEATRFCLNFFSKKLSVGGAIVVDDYGFLTCPGAKTAVDEFLKQETDKFTFLSLLSGQGILIKKS